jgi:hypothetical protein
MKHFLLILLGFNLIIPGFISAQPGTWTWVKGDTIAFAPGNYGVMGVPSVTNEPPGRYACSHWVDTSGNLWITGGDFSDLWKFDPVTTMWTWMNGDTTHGGADSIAAAKGIYNASNKPGVCIEGKCTWVTPDNHLWLLADFNNLWQYDPAVNQWAWMGATGPANYGTKGVGTLSTLPGDRVETSTNWVDNSGNLWLFGGYNGGDLNDMWEYTVSTGIWTWMSGTSVLNNTGTYGTLGVPSVNNIPPSRSSNIAWKDNAGNFWLAGGEAIGSTIYYQDVWEFNPVNLQWTWVAGTQGSDGSGSSGSACDTASTNKEGKRFENRATWKICDDLILNYSGQDAAGGANYFNDLWAYVPSLTEWVNIASAPLIGSYGVQGVANASNFPPSRVGAVGSVDKQHRIWMFGGTTGRANGNFFNDLWMYVIDTSCIGHGGCIETITTTLQATTNAINPSCNDSCNGTASVTASNGTPPYHYLWQPTNDTTLTINNLCAGTYIVSVTDAGGNTIVDSVTINAPAPPVVNISSDTSGFCANDSALICAPSGFLNYTWNDGPTDSCRYVYAAGNYYVSVTDNNGCTAESNHIAINVYPLPSVSIGVNGDTLTVNDAVSVQWYRNDSLIPGATGNVYIATQPGSYTVQVTDSNGCSAFSSKASFMGVVDLAAGGIEIYPNPSVGNWQLIVASELLGAALEVWNSEGQIIYQSKITGVQTTIRLPGEAKGVYLLRLSTPGMVLVKKLIKL